MKLSTNIPAMEATTSSFTTEELRAIYANASALFERTPDQFYAVPDTDPYALDRVWNTWTKTAAGGDEKLLHRRLLSAGLEEDSIRPLLGRVGIRDTLAPQEWWSTFEAVAQCFKYHKASIATPENRAYLQEDDPFPFETIWTTIVDFATERLCTQAGKNYALLSAKAVTGLQRSLLRKLFVLSSEIFLLEFNLFRRARMSHLARMLALKADVPKTEIYQEFIDFHLENGMKKIFMEYPVLARLVATVTNNWVAAITEFLERWEEDKKEISSRFFLNENLEIADIEGSLSDSHNHGRTVFILSLNNHKKIVYKPRTLFSEKLWNDVIAWTNKAGSLNIKRLHVWSREAYGWMEFADYNEFKKEGDLEKYYHNCGGLLALAYLLGSSDFHYENLIVSDGQPVIIDLETITHHARKDDIVAEGALDKLLNEEFGESVIRTGMLPRWIPGEMGEAIDISALGAVDSQRTRVKMPVWKHVNTDMMDREMEFKHSEPGKNAPKLAGDIVPPGPYRASILTGFTTVYEVFRNKREELLAQTGFLYELAGQQIRFIFRPTYRYYMLLHRCLDPVCMRNGAARSAQIESLAAELIQLEDNPAWPVLEQEHLALEREDCPYFYGPADGLEISGGAADIHGTIVESAFQRILERIRNLSLADLGKQKDYILASFDTRNHYSQHQAAVSEAVNITHDTIEQAVDRIDTQDTLKAAVEIGEQLLQTKVSYSAKGSTWMTLKFLPEINKHQLLGVGPDFFEGRTGIAFFLSALSVVSGQQKYADLALDTLAGVREDLRGSGANAAAEGIGLHGLTGLAGIMYGFVHIAELLQDDSLLQEAKNLLPTFLPKEETDGKPFDFLTGTAGTIACLLRFYRVTGDVQALEIAEQYGHLLLQARTSDASGAKGWATFEDKMITGFAHGQAGIAFAMHQLGQASGRKDFIAAARDAVAWEDSTFSEKAGNWPDLRWGEMENGEYSYADGWCHGAPGIALGRLGMLADGFEDTPVAFAAATQLIQASSMNRVDHLCCGNAGRLSILFELAQSNNDKVLAGELQHRIHALLERKAKDGSYKYWWTGYPNVTLPALYQGSTGIGYTLLRMLAPERLPNILLAR